jgi:hypothetical protein
MLDTGTTVPVLNLEDSDGRTVRLAEFRGVSAVLLYFMRTTTCAICNGHVRDLVGRSEEWADRDVAVMIAVPEGREAAAVWKREHKIPFTVVTGGGWYAARVGRAEQEGVRSGPAVRVHPDRRARCGPALQRRDAADEGL